MFNYDLNPFRWAVLCLNWWANQYLQLKAFKPFKPHTYKASMLSAWTPLPLPAALLCFTPSVYTNCHSSSHRPSITSGSFWVFLHERAPHLSTPTRFYSSPFIFLNCRTFHSRAAYTIQIALWLQTKKKKNINHHDTNVVVLQWIIVAEMFCSLLFWTFEQIVREGSRRWLNAGL